MKIFNISILGLIIFFIAMEISHSQTGQEYYDQGMKYGNLGRFQEAELEFKKALESEQPYEPAQTYLDLINYINDNNIPNKIAIHLFKKAGAESRGDLDKARDDFEAAIAVNPNNAQAYNDLAQAYYDANKLNWAVKYWDKAVTLGYKLAPGFLENLKEMLNLSKTQRKTDPDLDWIKRYQPVY